jgi:hypothetical protein
MTSINAGLNSYTQLGSAYTRAAATQPSLAGVLNAADSGNPLDSNAATNLTLSDAARAQLAGTAAQKSFSTVTSDARAALFAIVTNNGGKFSLDEQKAANTELGHRFNDALAPATATAKLTGDFSSLYRAALDYLDGASGEEKATAAWSALRSAVQKGVQATQQDPTTAPANIANDPVAAYLAQSADQVTTPTADISSVARKVRAALDVQAKAATAAGKELVFDAGRKTGQQADLSSMDNRSLAAVSLNQDGLFSNQESFAAKQALGSRNRASVLAALKQSQTSGDPSQLSLGILNTYSSMSAEERQAVNWSPAVRDNALANYKSSRHILSLLRGS